MGIVSNLISKLSDKALASDLLCPDENSEGIDMPITFSFPRASAAITAVRAESIPPLNPITAFEKSRFFKIISHSQ